MMTKKHCFLKLFGFSVGHECEIDFLKIIVKNCWIPLLWFYYLVFLLQHYTSCVLTQFAKKLLLKFWFHFLITSLLFSSITYSLWEEIGIWFTHFTLLFFNLNFERCPKFFYSLLAQTLKLIFLTKWNTLLACCVSSTNYISRKADYDENFNLSCCSYVTVDILDFLPPLDIGIH